MVIVRDEYNLSANAAFAEDAPLIVVSRGTNAISDPSSSAILRWVADGSGSPTGNAAVFSDASALDSSYPPVAAVDGQLTSYTVGDTTGTNHTFLLAFGEAVTVDACFLYLPNGSTSVNSIRVDVSEAASFPAFGSSTYELCTFTPADTDVRHVALEPTNTLATYTGVTHARITFFMDTGAAPVLPPRIGEVVLGQKRQLSYKFMQGADTNISASDWSDLETRGGNQFRHMRYRNRGNIRGTLQAHNSTMMGLNDLTMIEDIWDDCRQGKDPVVYVEDPTTTPGKAIFGYMMQKEKKFSYGGPNDAEVDVKINELPPFFGNE